jgi:hypothetical protein
MHVHQHVLMHCRAAGSTGLAGFEAAWRQMDRDTLELTRARRYLEVRRGELLGTASPGQRTDLEPLASVQEVEPTLAHRLRKLAGAKDRVLELLATATDADTVTRS